LPGLLAIVGLASIVAMDCFAGGPGIDAPRIEVAEVPQFEPDTTFPRLPNDWVLGNVSDVAVDRQDNVWILHRPRTVRAGKTAAPAVLEFDAAGNFLQAWGGEGSGFDWPDAEHNIFVDHRGNVWISGSSPSGQSKTTRSDDMLLEFAGNGKFMLQIGGRSVSRGSKDRRSVNKPGDVFVSAKSNEVYVADGYGNRRVVVFDSSSGAFRRMWGAFGKPPADDADSGGPGPSGGPLGALPAPAANAPAQVPDTGGDGPPGFASAVHGIVVSDDGLVYVADRHNRRVQVFSTAGRYIDQMFVNRAGPAADTVSALALSPDKGQRLLYMADFGNSRVVIADRRKLSVLGQFGSRGAEPGNFQGIHQLAVDSKGTLYTAEVAPGARIQKFRIQQPSVATLPASPAMPPCAGDIATVRRIEIIAPATIDDYLRNMDVHRAWYRAHGFRDNEIYAARVVAADAAAGVAGYSNSELIAYHVRPPYGPNNTTVRDPDWVEFHKVYDRISRIKDQYQACVPKNHGG
jgi:DNA-binding beta-propeller fold protein YncE